MPSPDRPAFINRQVGFGRSRWWKTRHPGTAPANQPPAAPQSNN
jgi:hypothetical protein